MNISTALLISTIIHAVAIFGFNGTYTKPVPKPQVSKPLIVKFINREQGNKVNKVVHGFGATTGQADTFSPDDSCAWSPELQQQMLEEDYEF